MVNVVTNEGDVVNKTVELHGRKIPLPEIADSRRKIHDINDNDIQKLSREQIIDGMERIHHTPDLDKPLELSVLKARVPVYKTLTTKYNAA